MVLEQLYKISEDKSIVYELNKLKEMSVGDISKIFVGKAIDFFIITKNKVPFYIFTSTDIIDALVAHNDEMKVIVYIDKNPKNIVRFTKSESIFSAYKTIRTYRIHHIIVTDEDGRFESVITSHDLAAFLTEIAIKDDLTNLYNKRFFEFIKDRYSTEDMQIGIIFIDLDNFKNINDTYGHVFGDKVLKRVAEIIRKNIRDIDYAFRFGGDEFVVVIFSDKKLTKKVSDRIAKEISKSYINTIQLRASVGYAHYKTDGNDLNKVLQKADQKMYMIKKEH